MKVDFPSISILLINNHILYHKTISFKKTDRHDSNSNLKITLNDF